jgi:hypothetical protein
MTLIGLEIDATRARAVCGPAGQLPAPLRLADTHDELLLAINLEKRQAQLGGGALTVCRKHPDFACLDFLPHLGRDRTWIGGRHRLDAQRAVGMVVEHLGQRFGKCDGAAMSVPAYFDLSQLDHLTRLAEKARWRVLGAMPRSLAAAIAAREHLPWTGVVLVLDIDGHALTWSAVGVEGNQATLLGQECIAVWSRNFWLSHLLNGIAERCIRQTRIDPRDPADMEQHVFEQLLSLLEHPPSAHAVAIELRYGHPPQRIQVTGADLIESCAPLAQAVAGRIEPICKETAAHGPVGLVVLTAAAAQMPGLSAAVEAALPRPPAHAPINSEDFGEGLLEEEAGPPAGALALGPDALARASHYLAVCIQERRVRGGLLHTLPLSRYGTVPRLHQQADDAPPSPTRLPFPPATPQTRAPAIRRRYSDLD